ncbi:MAG: type IV secretion protein IcmD [Pseudomonadota bacterium]
MACFYAGYAHAAAQDLGQVAQNVTRTLDSVAKLITAGSYVAGFGFAIGAILKFKAHKDNPTQIPVGTPIALIFIAAALIFLPSIFGVTGKTLFGAGSEVGGVSGVTTFGN